MTVGQFYTQWTPERLALAVDMLGRGFSDAEVAAEIGCTVAAMKERLRRMMPPGAWRDRLIPKSAMPAFDAASAARGVPRSKLVRAIMEALGADKTLLDNILDDGITTP